ncbi:MAG: L-serine ammonia-lyase, iron-sulfur-dependent, subunit alpha [Planctomycetota bacterium]|jgi:L-cysteine desulfidase
MELREYLAEEWKPALGCTEPASVAFATATAAAQASGPVTDVRLVCDPRIYKNCYAVGIPHSGHRVGILWAVAIGSLLPEPGLELGCFSRIDDDILEEAARLLEAGAVGVEVDKTRGELFVDCTVSREGGVGRAVIEREHTRLVRVERDGAETPLKVSAAPEASSIREGLSRLEFDDLLRMAASLGPDERASLRNGAAMNVAMARHGTSLLPGSFVKAIEEDSQAGASMLVCAGVYARMWGEDMPVMSLAGSGNKGIVCSVPLVLWGAGAGFAEELVDESLALACLVTSSTTHSLGSLSAVCGCSNAAGIGLAAGLVRLQGGGAREVWMAVNNMVGNVTGMICDGAKIGCALKTMTSVDAAFRSAALAMGGIGIPYSDGIVGCDGAESLANLGRIAGRGMAGVDEEILAIMREKLA